MFAPPTQEEHPNDPTFLNSCPFTSFTERTCDSDRAKPVPMTNLHSSQAHGLKCFITTFQKKKFHNQKCLETIFTYFFHWFFQGKNMVSPESHHIQKVTFVSMNFMLKNINNRNFVLCRHESKELDLLAACACFVS